MDGSTLKKERWKKDWGGVTRIWVLAKGKLKVSLSEGKMLHQKGNDQ
jgi:hypothetical protein